ncbi:hypothetical protein E4U38_005903 [Claviceps purpurea]|nr:hypothetical protein E4U38_005903 [Claviceps purpurea]KAG6148794.1 hypothetical protein E4U28_003255 [Claviceps purpurea]KAG6190087.1 hypothetical protein E4U10_004841 [Claviceps purpurea]KAG6270942.1 hypothetical protein E4U49_004953 [Claviceps purpurea]KAG6316129.1 hypothetical protein E4U44_000890 [Claviceps purpurea]
MDTRANCSDEALPDEDFSDEDLSAEEGPATLLARTPPTSLLKASILETFQRNPLLIEDFDTEQNQPEGSISERMLAFEENQTFNDAEDSSDVDLIVTEDPTASVNARASDADKNA